MNLDTTIYKTYQGLSAIGDWIALLGLRLFIAWEFWGAGIQKFNGSNWFEDIVDEFPFPFNIMPVAISWFIATWTEILGAIALTIGLLTRFWIVALIVLDLVAWISVHAGNGYNVGDNGYKLPLIYLIVMIPLLLHGPGKLSFDHAFALRFKS